MAAEKIKMKEIYFFIIISESGACPRVYDDYQWFRDELKTGKNTRQEICNDLLHKNISVKKKPGVGVKDIIKKQNWPVTV